jgi:hypothetical protein
MKTRILITTLTCALAASSLAADVKTTQRATIKFEGMLGRMIGLFGGSDDGKPQTVAVRGDRKAMLSEGSGRIVDLGEEKIYDVDARRKTYTVTTFDELRRQMKEAEEKAKQDAEEAGEEPSRDPGAPEYEIDFDVKETGSKKAIAGHDTRQVVATVTMRQKGKTLETGGGLVLTSDMWLAPRIAALDEIAAFDRRYAEQLYGLSASMSADQLAALIAMHPGFQDAQKRLAAEGAKLEGTPLMTTLTLESVKNPEQEVSSGGGSGLGGMAGRLMRRNRDKPGQKNRVFASTSETLSIATSVEDSDLAIPAGFKEKR